MGELLAQVGDLLFSLVISYLGALEFYFVVRHLYHWSFRHPNEVQNDADGLTQLQQDMRNKLTTAKAKEEKAGAKAMQDGVLYKDGFRITDPQQETTAQHSDNTEEEKQRRRKEIEEELVRQKKLEEEIRQQLEKAEAELEMERKKMAAQEEEQRNAEALILAEKLREEQERQLQMEEEERAENERRLLAAEEARVVEQKLKEEQQRQLQMEEEERAENERRLLAAEEARVAEQKLKEEAEELRRKQEQEKIEAERSIAAEQQRLEEARNARMTELEREREEQQQQLELTRAAEEEARRMVQAIREQEEQERETEANERERQLAIEQKEEQKVDKENEQRLMEAAEEEVRRMIQAIREQEEQEKLEEDYESEILSSEEEAQLQLDEENEQRLIEAERVREQKQRREEEEQERLFLLENAIITPETEAEEAARLLLEAEREQERKQHIIEENARKFLEAEEEMVELTRKMEEAVQQRRVTLNQQVSIVEEPCVKKVFQPLERTEPITHSVKTQFQQSSKSLNFPCISDDESSKEPNTSNSPSASLDTETLSEEIAVQEREAPDGGEDNTTDIQYTDDYLRSLDGIKQRPVTREDGSGRRRAFKKRRSSGSSNSSRDSRTSREEEVKMFTSLEEEEMQQSEKKGDEEEFTAIKYTSEPTLKVKGHHRRHKRSPAKDATKHSEESVRSSLEKLNEEQINPWGEVMPEHYKKTEFWKREKAVSIDEEKDVEVKTDEFEEATQQQNEKAITALQSIQSIKEAEEQDDISVDTTDTPIANESNTNLQTSQNTERTTSPARSQTSPRLRRSPRIDELDQYEKHEMQVAAATSEVAKNRPAALDSPSIIVNSSEDTAPWRDEHGLLMQGISDFYDFQASVNPSRSRPTSRATTPTSPKPEPIYPKNVAYDHQPASATKTLDIYDDTDNIEAGSLSKESLMTFLDELNDTTKKLDSNEELNYAKDSFIMELKEVADEPNMRPDIAMSMTAMPLVTINSGDSPITEQSVAENLQNSNPFEKVDNTENPTKDSNSNNNPEESLQDNMNKRRRQRSRSPLPTSNNIERSIESRRQKRIQHNDEVFEKLERKSSSDDENKSIIQTPTISVDRPTEDNTTLATNDEAASSEMINLVESLRVARVRSSRSRSKSPMRLPTEANLGHSVEVRRNKLIQQNDELLVQLTERAKTFDSKTIVVADVTTIPDDVCYTFVPSSSRRANFKDNDTSVELQDLSDYYDFQQLLNREALGDKTVVENNESQQTSAALRKNLAEEKALNRREATNDENEHEGRDNLGCIYDKNTLRRLKCTPTTPDYDRSISTEFQDVQRIKAEMLASGFKRSTYVGESIDLGSEYEDMRLEAAHFRRSKSQSRSPDAQEDQMIELARDEAVRKQQIQAEILAQITTDLQGNKQKDPQEKHGAKPKRENKKSSIDLEHSFSKECADTQRIREEQLNSGFQRSTYVGESLDMSAQYEEMRRDAAEFRRSRSKSRSPLDAKEVQMIAEIDAEAVKRELQDQILDEITKTTINFQDFSRHLNADFLDNDRRASDSALIQKPEIIFQLQDSDPDLDLDPEEYHHFRRFSLRQEEAVEEYPSDSDFMYMSQMDMSSPTGAKTWTRKDYYSRNLENLRIEFPDILISDVSSGVDGQDVAAAFVHDEEETDGSEDERRTVVDVEDEIEEDIGDFNERGTGDESHHEQSECEEADREIDRYADRRAEDWINVEENVMEIGFYQPRQNTDEVEVNEEGAVGGLGDDAKSTYDSDSFAIDEIYDEAIRNRKQSGILRDYDSIIQEMQPSNFTDDSVARQGYEDNWQNNEDRYALWAKTRQLERGNSYLANSADSALNFLENERRYLSDAISNSQHNSTRLRSRYGFMPVLQKTDLQESIIDVDLNYKPKREYNWRKNFKIDEDEDGQREVKEDQEEAKEESNEYTKEDLYKETQEVTNEDNTVIRNENDETTDLFQDTYVQPVDIRKFSLGGESITLFSRSPDREILLADVLEESCAIDVPEKKCETFVNEIVNPKKIQDNTEKGKKKKSKRKTRRESKDDVERFAKEEEDSDPQTINRRSNSIQMETDSPKRKSRSRRNSKNSLNNDDALMDVYSPRGSIDEPFEGFAGEYTVEIQKKKTKKRKKTKESKFIHEPEIKEEHFARKTTGLATVAPDAAFDPLSAESTSNSLCATPASLESLELKDNFSLNIKGTVATTSTTALTTASIATSSTASTTASTKTSTTASTTDSTTASSTSSATATTTASTPTTPADDSFDILKDASFYPLF